MTAPRRDNQHQSGFAQWVRDVPQLDSRSAGVCNTDLDWIWHQFKEPSDNIAEGRRVNHVMFIEEKSHGASATMAQRDTMKQLHQVFDRKMTRRMFRVINERNQQIWMKFWGWFTLEYSGSRPDASETILWDGKPIDIATLTAVLRFDRRPDKPSVAVDRRICHHRKNQMNLYAA